MAKELKKEDLRRFARLGAMRRLEDIRQEEAAIRSAFPELFGGRGATKRRAAPARAARKRPKMSAAARKAVSERMKKYWAARRKPKNG